MSRPLEGKVALITGASRGIGEAIARNLANKGASVVINYVSDSSEANATKIAAELQISENIRAIPVRADIATIEGPTNLVAATVRAFGPSIDILVNNAAIAACLTVEDSTPEAFDAHYHLNVRGPMLLVQAALPYLPKDGSGRIINISSISSTIGFPMQTLYGGTKAALDAMTRTWARELAGHCTANTISVGPVATDLAATNPPEFVAILNPFIAQTPRGNTTGHFSGQGRRGETHEVAKIVGMIALPDSDWCTGSLVSANGGLVFPR